MNVLINGRYFGIFTVTCGTCGFKYEVTGHDEFTFTDEDEEDTIYSGN